MFLLDFCDYICYNTLNKETNTLLTSKNSVMNYDLSSNVLNSYAYAHLITGTGLSVIDVHIRKLNKKIGDHWNGNSVLPSKELQKIEAELLLFCNKKDNKEKFILIEREKINYFGYLALLDPTC